MKENNQKHEGEGVKGNSFFQLGPMFTAASELASEREEGRQGAAEASAGLSGRRGEEEEADVERRSQGEASEVGVVLSEQEAQDLEGNRVKT